MKPWAPLLVFGIRIKNVIWRFISGGTLAIGEDNQVVTPWASRRLHITIHGNRNHVVVSPNFKGKARITICGNDNRITLGASEDACWKIDFFPKIGGLCHNAFLNIGERVRTSGEVWIRLGEHRSSVRIGDDSIFSWGVVIWNTDGHSLFPFICSQHAIPFNIGRELTIGSHTWLGMDVKVLKNAHLPDNTVVGMGAIVTGRFDEPFCVLAGNPAKVIRRNTRWEISPPNAYCD